MVRATVNEERTVPGASVQSPTPTTTCPSQSVIALLDSTLGDAVIYGGGEDIGHGNTDGGNAAPRQSGDLSCFGGIVYPSDEFQFWSG